jgi:outer membrane protein assembly factor BamB
VKLLRLAISATFLAACSSGSPGPAPAPLPQLSGAKAIRVLWRAEVGAAENFFFTPALVGDAVYAASRDGAVRRLDAASGRVR